MKVGIFVSGYLPFEVYGVPRHVERLANYLGRNGYETWIFVRGGRGLPKREKQREGVTIFRTPYVPYPFTIGKGRFETFVYTFFTVLQVVPFINKNSIRLLVGNGTYYGGWQAAIASALTKVPFVCTIHGFGIDYYAGSQSIPPMLRFVTKARRIIVQKRSAVEILRRWGIEHPRVVYLEEGGVDTDVFKPKEREGKKSSFSRIGFAGRLISFKGPRLLIEAIPHVLEQYGSVEFLFAGEGPDKGELIDLMRSLGVDEHVKFLGQIRDMTLFYKKLDIFVALSPYNNFSDLALMEAMASGIPTVATDSGETARMIRNGENGMLISPDPKELAKKILLLLQTKEIASKLGGNGRKYIEEHCSLEIWGKEMEKIIVSSSVLEVK